MPYLSSSSIQRACFRIIVWTIQHKINVRSCSCISSKPSENSNFIKVTVIWIMITQKSYWPLQNNYSKFYKIQLCSRRTTAHLIIFSVFDVFITVYIKKIQEKTFPLSLINSSKELSIFLKRIFEEVFFKYNWKEK